MGHPPSSRDSLPTTAASPCLDWARLAEQNENIAGRLPLASCPRALAALPLSDGQLPIAWQVNASTMAEPVASAKARRVTVRFQGDVTLTCPRCLSPLPWTLQDEVPFYLVDTPPSPLPESEEDWLEEAEPLYIHQPLAELLDELVLLALPQEARHNHCAPPEAPPVKLPTAFDALAALRDKLSAQGKGS